MRHIIKLILVLAGGIMLTGCTGEKEAEVESESYITVSEKSPTLGDMQEPPGPDSIITQDVSKIQQRENDELDVLGLCFHLSGVTSTENIGEDQVKVQYYDEHMGTEPVLCTLEIGRNSTLDLPGTSYDPELAEEWGFTSGAGGYVLVQVNHTKPLGDNKDRRATLAEWNYKEYSFAIWAEYPDTVDTNIIPKTAGYLIQQIGRPQENQQVMLGVKKVTERELEVKVSNHTNQRINYSDDYFLEKKDDSDGEWKIVEPSADNFTFNDIAYEVEPGGVLYTDIINQYIM